MARIIVVADTPEPTKPSGPIPMDEEAERDHLRVQPNGQLVVGQLAVTTSVQQVRSYLDMERC